MREKERRHEAKELGLARSGVGRHRIPTVHRKNQLAPLAYFYPHDRYTWSGQRYITLEELSHRLTISVISAGITGFGIGELLAKIFGG